MIFLHDTRDKQGKHNNVDDYLRKLGHEVIYVKLDVGDVALQDNPFICIDLKRNLEELSKNLMNKKDHSRFWKEVRRAKEKSIKLIILCEHGGQVKKIPDVANWHSKYSPVSGRVLMDEIYRVHIAYGVEFLFCDKRSTGRKIIEILDGEI